MTKIVRTKTRAEGGITAEEKARMDEHARLWQSRAFRTDPIEPDKIIPAIRKLYAAAGMKAPRIVIVPSPLVMAFAYGASAAIWHARDKDSATRSATHSATRSATLSATRSATLSAARSATLSATDSAARSATLSATASATRSATLSATDSATDGATRSATDGATLSATDSAARSATLSATLSATDSATLSATRSATDSATDGATLSATLSATHSATRSATDGATRSATDGATRSATDGATRSAETLAALACEHMAGRLGLECAKLWSSAYQGGNMWAGYNCYLTACRDILGLELKEHAAYAAWEQAAIHGGFRVMHEEFCLVSDFPEVLSIDDQNRPHCETGPSHRWCDGWSLYHWHGVRVPAHWIEDRANLDPNEVIKADNVEQRAAGAAIVGWPKMLGVLKAKTINAHANPEIGELIELTLPGLDEPGLFLKATCPRNGLICEGVPRVSDIDGLPIKTAIAAQAWRIGDPVSEFIIPPLRT